jgi:NADH:ubiquinone reductase (H+-translocating)
VSAKHVVIAGGGFGGYYTAKALERTLPPDVRITLVSDVNYLLYTPLLPGAAAGSL